MKVASLLAKKMGHSHESLSCGRRVGAHATVLSRAISISSRGCAWRETADRIKRFFWRMFFHTPKTSRIIPGIALAGTRVMNRMTGRAAVTSHRGSGSTVLRAPRQAGMPGEGGQPIDRRRRQGRRSTVRPSSRMTLRDACPAEWAADTGRGRRPESLPPPDAKGSGWVERPPIKI